MKKLSVLLLAYVLLLAFSSAQLRSSFRPHYFLNRLNGCLNANLSLGHCINWAWARGDSGTLPNYIYCTKSKKGENRSCVINKPPKWNNQSSQWDRIDPYHYLQSNW